MRFYDNNPIAGGTTVNSSAAPWATWRSQETFLIDLNPMLKHLKEWKEMTPTVTRPPRRVFIAIGNPTETTESTFHVSFDSATLNTNFRTWLDETVEGVNVPRSSIVDGVVIHIDLHQEVNFRPYLSSLLSMLKDEYNMTIIAAPQANNRHMNEYFAGGLC